MTTDPLEPVLRKALRSLREDTPSNNLARMSILASLENAPELLAIAEDEMAQP